MQRKERLFSIASVSIIFIASIFLIRGGWRIPYSTKLPSEYFASNDGKIQRSMRDSASKSSNHTTQAAIFHTAKEQKLLQKYLGTKTLSIFDLNVIPGLANTKSFNSWRETSSVTQSMVPQGISVSKDWIFISAYDASYETNSVVYMLKRSTGKLSKTIILRGQPHVGGITFDPKNQNLWIAGYRNRQARLIAISLDHLLKYPSAGTQPIKYDQEVSLPLIKRASFIEYHKESIYVGNFQLFFSGDLQRVSLTKKGKIAKSSTFDYHSLKSDDLPKLSQGIAFSDKYTFISQSHSRYDSYLYVYPNKGLSDYGNSKPLLKLKLPAMMEDLAFYDNTLYAVHESGGAVYRNKYGLGVDRVMTYSISHIDRLIKTAQGGK